MAETAKLDSGRSILTLMGLLACVLSCDSGEAEKQVGRAGIDYGIDHTKTVADYEKEVGLSAEEMVRHFTLLLNTNNTILEESRFLGIQTWQNPFDVWITQEIIFETKPDVIVEAGTFRGGSALLWAMFLEQVNPAGRVVTIDIQDKRDANARSHRLASKVDFLTGSSTDPAIVAAVSQRVAGKRALVILDSLHTREHVAGELAAYAPFVPVGGYIIVQDTAVGAIHAAREFVAANDAWQIDLSRQRMLYTNNHEGFLKRIR